MTLMGSIAMLANQNDPDGTGVGNLFVSIGLPAVMAEAFAGARRVLTLTLADITTDRMAPLKGAFVACPLRDGYSDVHAVIAALEAAGFNGQLAVISPRLPDVDMVERELRAHATQFRVNVIPL